MPVITRTGNGKITEWKPLESTSWSCMWCCTLLPQHTYKVQSSTHCHTQGLLLYRKEQIKRKKNAAHPLSSPFFSPGFCLFFESSSYHCLKYKIAILRRKCTEAFANSVACSELQSFPSKYALCPWRGFALCPASPAPETLLTQRVCYMPYRPDNWLVSVPQSSL